MNTQSVSIKITAQKSPGRWDSDSKARLDCVIVEQHSYLTQLYQVQDLQLSQEDKAEKVLRLLSLVNDSVHEGDVLCWERLYPLILLYVVQPWLQTRDHAIHLYGVIGHKMWEIVQKDPYNNINFSRAMMRLEEC